MKDESPVGVLILVIVDVVRVYYARKCLQRVHLPHRLGMFYEPDRVLLKDQNLMYSHLLDHGFEQVIRTRTQTLELLVKPRVIDLLVSQVFQRCNGHLVRLIYSIARVIIPGKYLSVCI